MTERDGKDIALVTLLMRLSP